MLTSAPKELAQISMSKTLPTRNPNRLQARVTPAQYNGWVGFAKAHEVTVSELIQELGKMFYEWNNQEHIAYENMTTEDLIIPLAVLVQRIKQRKL